MDGSRVSMTEDLFHPIQWEKKYFNCFIASGKKPWSLYVTHYFIVIHSKGTAFFLSLLLGWKGKNLNPFPVLLEQCASCVNDKLIRTAFEGLKRPATHTESNMKSVVRMVNWIACMAIKCDVLSSYPNIKWTQNLLKIIHVCCVHIARNNNHCANVSDAIQKPEMASGQWNAFMKCTHTHTDTQPEILLVTLTPCLTSHTPSVSICIGKLWLRIVHCI